MRIETARKRKSKNEIYLNREKSNEEAKLENNEPTREQSYGKTKSESNDRTREQIYGRTKLEINKEETREENYGEI